jgi:hypothetical protein
MSNLPSPQLPNNILGEQENNEKKWTNTSLVLAPSPAGGWGVFAARPFQKGEIVELSPLFCRFTEDCPTLKQSILDNYHYEYWGSDALHYPGTMLSFGFFLFYNHSPDYNIKYFKLGKERTIENSQAVIMGFYALKDIQVGEELLNNYGGEEWFQKRGLEMLVPSITSKPSQEQTAGPITEYASKLYSGYGVDTYWAAINENHQLGDNNNNNNNDEDYLHKGQKYNVESILEYLPPFDAGYQQVVAKERVEEGQLLEIGPALILDKTLVQDTILEPLALFWDDFENADEHTTQIPPIHSCDDDTVLVLHLSASTGWKRILDRSPREDTVLLPLCGSVGLILRSRIRGECNCRLLVQPDPFNEHAFTLRVIATKVIEQGEIVKVYLNGSSLKSREQRQNLMIDLLSTGQPLPAALLIDTENDFD